MLAFYKEKTLLDWNFHFVTWLGDRGKDLYDNEYCQYESNIRYPTEVKLFRECIEWSYTELKKHNKRRAIVIKE